MNRFPVVAALAAIVAAGSASAAAVEARTFSIDRAHSSVGFSIRHFFTKVPGSFHDFTGTIRFDPRDLAASSVEVTIRDSSINTGNEKRDADLLQESFFWAEKHPTITFKSTRVIPGADSSRFQIEGDLTIRGVTKPVVLDAEWLGMADVSAGGRDMGTRAGFAATTRIDRKDFGIVWNRTLDQGGVMLGDDVDIVLNVEAVSMEKPGVVVAPVKAVKKK